MQIIANDVAQIATTIELIEKQIHSLGCILIVMFLFIIVLLGLILADKIGKHT